MHVNEMISPTIAYEMLSREAYYNGGGAVPIGATATTLTVGSSPTTNTGGLTTQSPAYGGIRIATGGTPLTPVTTSSHQNQGGGIIVDPQIPPTGGTKSNGDPLPSPSGGGILPDVGGVSEQKPAPIKKFDWLPVILGITGLYLLISK